MNCNQAANKTLTVSAGMNLPRASNSRLITRGFGSYRLGGCSPKVCGSGALRPNRALVMPIQVFDRSLNVPSAVRQSRTSKSRGGTEFGGAVSVSNRLRQRKSTRNDNKFTTATGNGRRCQTRQRLTMRKTAAINSKKLATITLPFRQHSAGVLTKFCIGRNASGWRLAVVVLIRTEQLSRMTVRFDLGAA